MERVMGCVNGRWVQREESGMGREEEEERKKKRKEKRWFGKEKTRHRHRPHNMNIFTKMPL